MPRNFLLKIKNNKQVFSVLEEITNLMEKKPSQLEHILIKKYNIHRREYEKIKELFDIMISQGFTPGLANDVSFKILNDEKYKHLLLNIGKLTPSKVSYFIRYHIFETEFENSGNKLIHKYPSYIEYKANGVIQPLTTGISLELPKNIKKPEDWDSLKTYINSIYRETYSKLFNRKITNPTEIIGKSWRDIVHRNGDEIERLANISGKKDPFISSNVPLAAGSAGRHEITQESDFELGLIKIKGINSDKAFSEVKNSLTKPYSPALNIEYDPKTKKINIPEDIYVHAELFDAVPLIDKENKEQFSKAVEFRKALLNASTTEKVFSTFYKDLTDSRNFIHKVAYGHERLADELSIVDIKHTFSRYAMLVPKILFIMYYRSSPEFRKFIEKKIESDPMYSLMNYKNIQEWMSFAEKRKVEAPIKFAKIMLTLRELLPKFWEKLDRELNIETDKEIPTCVPFLLPPKYTLGIIKLIKEAHNEMAEISQKYLPSSNIRDERITLK